MNKVARQWVQLVFAAALALTATGLAAAAKPGSQPALKAKAMAAKAASAAKEDPSVHSLQAALDFMGKAKLELEESKHEFWGHRRAAMAQLDTAVKEIQVALDDTKARGVPND